MDTQAVNGMPRRNRFAARSSSVTLAAGTVAALAAIYLGNHLGWWWITFAVGCGVGLLRQAGGALPERDPLLSRRRIACFRRNISALALEPIVAELLTQRRSPSRPRTP